MSFFLSMDQGKMFLFIGVVMILVQGMIVYNYRGMLLSRLTLCAGQMCLLTNSTVGVAHPFGSLQVAM